MYHKQIKNGFILFEIVVAFIIFSISCILLAQQQWKLIQQEQEAVDRLQALSLVRNTLENIRNEKYFSPFQKVDDKFTIIVQEKPLSLQTINTEFLNKLNLIEARVTWQSALGKRSIKLITGFIQDEKK